MARTSSREDVRIRIGGDLRRVPLSSLTTSLLRDCRPVREFRWHYGQPHFPGMYWSATNGDHVTYESRHELKRLQIADFDPRVIAIRSQPFFLEMPYSEGRLRRHVPDFALLESDGLVRIVNVKPAEKLEDPEVRDALTRAHSTLERHGFATELWSDAPIQYLANLRFIAGYRNSALFDHADVATAVTAIVGATTLGEAEDAIRAASIVEPRPLLLHLVWRGDVHIDMTAKIEHHTPLEAA